MIEIHSPLEFEADAEGAWGMILWVGHPFDYATPFRAIIADIAQMLGRDYRNDLHLPLYDECEDFVSGTLDVGTSTLRIYYEYSLGYLQLTSDTENALRDVAYRLRSSIVLAL